MLSRIFQILSIQWFAAAKIYWSINFLAQFIFFTTELLNFYISVFLILSFWISLTCIYFYRQILNFLL